MTYQLGLDLGTTASAAAVNDGGEVSILTLGHQSLVVPSVVHLDRDGSLLVGEAAERRAKSDPGGVAREFKRRFGDPQPLILNGSPVAANDLMAALATHLVDEATAHKGERPEGIVVCHPANWGEYKVALLSDTLAHSALPAHRLITEPVAAAIHGAAEDRMDVGSVLAVYDLGGGTFDVALLRKLTDGWEPIGRPGGIERLGGIDFDAAILHRVLDSSGLDMSAMDESDEATVAGMNRLRQECRAAKHVLSEDTATSIPLVFPGHTDNVRLTRAEFEALITPAVGRTLEVFDSVVGGAGMAMDEIDRILLVGGSTRIPLVRQRVLEHTGRPVTVDPHPKHAIALGAAAGALPPSPGATPPASDMYSLPHISEAPLPDFLLRRAPSESPAAAPAGVPGRLREKPSTPAPAPTPVPPPVRSTPSTRGSGRPGRKGLWIVVGLVVAFGVGATALALAGRDPDGFADPTAVDGEVSDTTNGDTTNGDSTNGAESIDAAAAPPTATQPDGEQIVVGASCASTDRPDPAVVYRVSDVPADDPEQSLNGRNIPSVRPIGGIASVPVTTFPELSTLDLTYTDCALDQRGRAWWGVHFEGGVVWASTLFIEPVER